MVDRRQGLPCFDRSIPPLFVAFRLSSPSTDQIEPLRSWAEVDRSSLLHNLGVIERLAGPGRQVMAVVKADAYGHGLRGVVRSLAGRVPWFGVANVREALCVLEEAPGDVFILGPVLPAERRFLQSERLSVAVSQLEEARALQDLGWPIRVHLSIDTGMGRMGCLSEEAAALAGQIRQMSNLRLEGLCTHFPSADEDADFTRLQIGVFRSLLQTQPAFSWVHLDNSAGILDFLEWQPDANLVRPGLMLYGLCPMGTHQDDLRPVMSLRSRVTLVRQLPSGHSISYGRTYVTSRPTLVATVGIGYGDGYPRQVSNQGAEVLIRGRRCPILGRVTMDQIMVDVSALSGSCLPGEVVTLIGRDGSECILASEVATWAGTISWDILTGLTSRVERVVADTNS